MNTATGTDSLREILEKAILADPSDIAAWSAWEDHVLETTGNKPVWKRLRRRDTRDRVDQESWTRCAWRLAHKDEQDKWLSWLTGVPEYMLCPHDVWISYLGFYYTCPLLKRVRFKDKKPLVRNRAGGIRYYWGSDKFHLQENRWVVRDELFLELKSLNIGRSYREGYLAFPTMRAARLAMSEAAINWAKKKKSSD